MEGRARPGKPPGRLGGDGAAVSDVLATILLIGVTVVASALFSAAVAQLPPPVPESRPDVAAFIHPSHPDRFVAEHRGGPELPLSQLTVALAVDQTTHRLRLSDVASGIHPGWTLTAADGRPLASAERFGTGDRLVYQNATVQGGAVSLSLIDVAGNRFMTATVRVQAADATPPALVSARTIDTNTVEVRFSEPLREVAAADFTVDGTAALTASLVGRGDRAHLVVAAPYPTDSTPLVLVSAPAPQTTDVAGNALQTGAQVTAVDGVPPTVSNLVVSPSNTSAALTFNTSEPATVRVDYGPTLLFGLHATAGVATTGHAIALEGLTPATLYHYRVTVTDAQGNAGTPLGTASLLTTAAPGEATPGPPGADARHLRWTLPANANPGIPTPVTVTLHDAAGNPVAAATDVTVSLATGSDRGSFLPTAASTPITSATIPPGASSVSFRYVDQKPTGSPALHASAHGIIPATGVLPLQNRGLVPQHGDTLASVRVILTYASDQGRNLGGTVMGVALVNPTPTARTVDRVTIVSSTSFGTGPSSFFRPAIGTGAGSDAELAGCGLAPNVDAITCEPGVFSVPAYGMRQFTVVFSTSNSGTTASTFLQATAFMGDGSSVASEPVPVRHEGSSGSSLMVYPTPLDGTGNERGGVRSLPAANGDVPLRWHSKGVANSVVSRIAVPAGWTVSVPEGQASLTALTVTVEQPTAHTPGQVVVGQRFPSGSQSRDLTLRFSGPASDALQLLVIQTEADAGTGRPAAVTVNHLAVSRS